MFDVVALEELGRKIAGADAGAAGDDELCDAAVALARLISRASAGLAHVAAELDRRGVCDEQHGMTTGSWLAREGMLPIGVARGHVKVGAALRHPLVVTNEAVCDGRLGAHHARVLADACTPRVADALTDLQQEIIALAEHASFEQWRREVRGIVELLDQDGAHDPQMDLARNTLSVADTIDGITYLSGQLVGDVALGVRTAIETKADELFHQFRADQAACDDLAVPERPVLRALALADLVRAGLAVDVERTRPPRPEVTLVVPADDSDRTLTSDGVTLQDGTVRHLRCDADLFAVVVDSLGVPLDLGRHVRLATTAQRRALAARDGGCVFPGCAAPPAWTDAHHVDPFRLGGRTDVARMASLCRRHHGVTHRRNWQMHATDDGWFWWRSPSGRTFWSQRHGRRRAGPAPPAATPATSD